MTRRKPSGVSAGGVRNRFAPRSRAVASALRLFLFLAEAGLLAYALVVYRERVYPRIAGSPTRGLLAAVFVAAIAWFLIRSLREAWTLRKILKR
ncbi:MAG: hypothetical protein EHM19_07340 [Candidatus Latescibacterota bacterium]|nr:MAG: hypothetical protein EHM19_07340 [Candidatus Latescibacterota bacterium]